MNNIKLKRFTAYLIDLIIISLLITLLGQIKFLNPFESKYENVAKEYETYYEDKFSDSKSLSLTDLTEKKYLNLIHDLSYYSMSYTIIEITVIILYFTLFPLFFNGQTIGKKICKIKIVNNIENKKLSFINLLIRTILYPIWTSIILYTTLSNIILLLSVIFFKGIVYFYTNLIISIVFAIYSYIDVIMLFAKDKSLHDLISNTKVIECK
ncbi:MAG: RDD family protein [bacterium]|nr:RDD family protein [bacterium]